MLFSALLFDSDKIEKTREKQKQKHKICTQQQTHNNDSNDKKKCQFTHVIEVNELEIVGKSIAIITIIDCECG